jgi:hypothetical protein
MRGIVSFLFGLLFGLLVKYEYTLQQKIKPSMSQIDLTACCEVRGCQNCE